VIVGWTRHWPWAPLIAGAALALYFFATDLVQGARERERIRERQAWRAAKFAPRCGYVRPREPSRVECALGMLSGAELSLLSACLLTGRRGRWPGRSLWRARGGAVRVLWSALLLLGVAVQLWLLGALFQSRQSPDPKVQLWLVAFSPTFIVPFVGLTGCLFAKVNAEATPQR
jgi:hypothetical protein